jgi:oligoribonuclease NrnB/cAMP/cGMP phosphodiesterase (DHH superfamily)
MYQRQISLLPAKKSGHICFFHRKCPDGAAGAWVVRKRYPDVELVPVGHRGMTDKHVNRCRGRDVFIIDTTQDREVLERVSEVSRSLVVLDHHVTSLEPYEGLGFASVDVGRCAALMTWDYLFPGKPAPQIITYVDDLDRWQNCQPDCEQVHEVLRGCKTVDEIHMMHHRMETYFHQVVNEGQGLLDERERYISFAMKRVTPALLGGVEVMAVEGRKHRSHLGNRIAEAYGAPGVVWSKNFPGGSYTYSLRSSEGGVDVAALAETLGGGGHVNASGIKSDSQLLTVDGRPVKSVFEPDPKPAPVAVSGSYSQSSGLSWSWSPKSRKHWHECPDCGREFRRGSGKWGLQRHQCRRSF